MDAKTASWLQAAIDEGGGTHTLEDIRQAIEDGRMVLRTFPHCAFLLEIVTYPKFKALRVTGAGGECNAALSEVLDFSINDIPALTKAAGLHRYEFRGREGWKRVLKPLGMTCHVFMFKDI
jgi:hypothetical protein